MTPKDVRLKMGYKQLFFARLLGVSNDSISRYERGASTPTGATADTYELLAEALTKGHTAAKLLALIEDLKPSGIPDALRRVLGKPTLEEVVARGVNPEDEVEVCDIWLVRDFRDERSAPTLHSDCLTAGEEAGRIGGGEPVRLKALRVGKDYYALSDHFQAAPLDVDGKRSERAREEAHRVLLSLPEDVRAELLKLGRPGSGGR